MFNVFYDDLTALLKVDQVDTKKTKEDWHEKCEISLISTLVKKVENINRN